MVKIKRNRSMLAALSVFVIAVTLGVVYKVALADDTVNLPGGEVSSPGRTWVRSMARKVYNVALAALNGGTVNLPGGEVSSPNNTWLLSDVVLNTATNKVSGRLVLTESGALSNITAATLSIATYDSSSLPLVIVKRSTTVQPVYDGVAKTLTWDFTDFQIPAGERFGGVYVSGGTYVRQGLIISLRVAVVWAHDGW